MLNKLWRHFKSTVIYDNRGELGTALLVGGGLMGGGALLGGIFGKDKKKEDIYDPYAPLRADWQKYMQGQLGQQTPFDVSEKFKLDQPEVESAAERNILGKLRSPYEAGAFSKDITDKYKGFAKESAREDAASQIIDERNMYNRLGLVSSSPWLERHGEIQDSLQDTLSEIEAKYAYEDIAREIQGKQLAEQINTAYLSQAVPIAASRLGQQQYPMEMSMKDLERLMAEEQYWAGLGGSVLGANPPQRTVTYEPNIAKKLGGAAMDIGKTVFTAGMLGGGGGGSTTGPITGGKGGMSTGYQPGIGKTWSPYNRLGQRI